MTTYEWQPITDLPDDWQRLADTELPPLACVWADQRGRLAESGEVERFNERLRRQWAIETGIIERLYDIDRGVTQLLIEKGINASLVSHGDTDRPADEVIAIVKDQQETVEGLFDFVLSRRDLSTSYIKDLHQLLTRHQPTTTGRDGLGRTVATSLRAGDWKQWPNNPTREDGSVFEYCPPEQVGSEMDRLIEMHLRHVAEGVPPEVEAAWLHHRFTQIHPFQDGNGRVARCLATLVFLRAGWFPLVVTRDDRAAYIDALEAADEGELSGLVGLFVAIERKAMLQALDLSEQVVGEVAVGDIIAAATEKLLERRRELASQREHAVFTVAAPLQAAALQSLTQTADELGASLRLVDATYEVVVSEDQYSMAWHGHEVAAAGRKLGYAPNTRVYHRWYKLTIETDTTAEALVSFHGLGEVFHGVLAVTVTVSRWPDEPVDVPTDVAIACPRVFQVNYLDDPEAAQARFESWLSESLVIALDQWRRWL